MKASEARKISNEKAITLTDIIKGIKQDAENGNNSHFTPPNRSVDIGIVTSLIGLGYSVKEHTDPFHGWKSYLISW